MNDLKLSPALWLEDEQIDALGEVEKLEWHAKIMRDLAAQLTSKNDFYWPALSIALLIDDLIKQSDKASRILRGGISGGLDAGEPC